MQRVVTWSGIVVWLTAGLLNASPFDIVINEIHYNPLGGEEADEFVELHNRGPTAVDLSGWRFTEGIHLELPPGTAMEPKSYLIVSADAARAAERYGPAAIVGNYAGQLDNGGEIVTLANRDGEIISRVHYLDGGPGYDDGSWPSSPDGGGPSLELLDPHAPPDRSTSWAPSRIVGGTPGRANSRGDGVQRPPEILVGAASSWTYFKGRQEPSVPVEAWNEPTFDDGSWSQGPAPFGYGNDVSFGTELSDMRGDYTTVYLRTTFALTADDVAALQAGEAELTIDVQYDDGCVAYINGTEVLRANAGTSGQPLPHDALADGSDSATASRSLQDSSGVLVEGSNTLAIQGLNQDPDSHDFLIDSSLRIQDRVVLPGQATAGLRVNEVRPPQDGTPGFIEIYNASAAEADLAGHAILDSTGNRSILSERIVPPGGRVAIEEPELAAPAAITATTYVLVKVEGMEGDVFVDALEADAPPQAAAGYSVGRVPDGGEDTYVMEEPTPGASNHVEFPASVVINEIHFHPPFVPPSGGCARNCSDAYQWIELVNRSGAAVDLSGWKLTKGVLLTMPEGFTIQAGGYVVLAASRDTFLAAHPGVDPAIVAGDWQRHLARDSDTVNLRDELGNRVDHVKYGDGKPVNDIDPADGENDRTFRGTTWPWNADRSGKTLELIHPGLDNRQGGAWRAGPAEGTPAAVNASFDPSPPAVIDRVKHSPAVPAPGVPVAVTCRVSSTRPLASVQAVWHVDESAAGGSVLLADDGIGSDEEAGDGEFTGIIPAQPEGAVVAFQVVATVEGGPATTVPETPSIAPYGGFAGPFFLYQVLSGAPPANASESYFIVMTAADRDELESRSAFSDELLPCTLIHAARDGSTAIRHLAGIRYRGSALRRRSPKSYRIDFPSEQRLGGIMHLNLNGQGIEQELLVSDLFRRAGMPYPQEWSVNLIFRGNLDTHYARKEHLDVDFLYRYFGGASASGNLYRAIDPDGDPRGGELAYYGEDPEEYVEYYQKRTNKEEADYSDVIELCRAFDPAQTPQAEFVETVERLADVNQWARYFAIQSLISNSDGSIQTSSGEDYFLYKVPETSNRADAGKWVLLPWDIDESFTDANEALFPSRLPSIRRFLRHPQFAPLYYANLVNLRHGVFSRFETRQRFVLIDFLFGFGTIDSIDTYITRRLGFIDREVPVELSSGVGDGLSTGDFLVREGDTWTYHKGRTPPLGGDLSWTQVDYEDGSWESGPSGIGYGDGDDATVVADMRGNYTTLFARRSFAAAAPSTIASLTLQIDYDDGFVAYLNGTEVARRNVAGDAGTIVEFDDVASGSREAGTPESIDISQFANLLEATKNVLAVVVLNHDASSSDLSLIPQLVAGTGQTGGMGCGTTLYADGDSIALTGRADAGRTRSVTVNGLAAAYDPFSAVWSALVPLEEGDNAVTVEAHDGPGGTGEIFQSREVHITRLPRPPVAVSGTLSGTTRWTEQEGPYLLSSDVTIPRGSRLEIEAGTLILARGGASIFVRGAIEALGTAASPILLRATSCSNRWGGIALDGTGTGQADVTHVLRYCDLEFGDTPPGFSGCVAPVDAKILCDHCSFQFLTANAINGTNARVEVRDCLFDKIHEGVHCTQSTVVILDSTFRGMIGDKDAIDFDFNGDEPSRIERCLIENGSDDGIDLQNTTVDIRDNVFRNIADKALSLDGDGPLGPPTVTGNLVYNSGTAIALKSGIHVAEGHHNTVVGNQEGVRLWANAGASDGGHGTFHSMIVWNNITDVKLDALSSVTFTHSDISAGVFPGEGNIAQDPAFVDTLLGDFSLEPDSPCIRTGLDGTDMGALPFDGAVDEFVRADADGDALLAVTDAIRTLDFLFRAGEPGPCLDAMDANDDGAVDISDSVYTLLFLFVGGDAPPPPYPDAGPDPTPDELGCR